MGKQQTSEIGMQPFIPRNQLVTKRQSRHQSSLLQPKDGSKRSGKEDSFDGGESDESFSEGGTFVRDPFECPVGFFGDAGDCRASEGEVGEG